MRGIGKATPRQTIRPQHLRDAPPDEALPSRTNEEVVINQQNVRNSEESSNEPNINSFTNSRLKQKGRNRLAQGESEFQTTGLTRKHGQLICQNS